MDLSSFDLKLINSEGLAIWNFKEQAVWKLNNNRSEITVRIFIIIKYQRNQCKQVIFMIL